MITVDRSSGGVKKFFYLIFLRYQYQVAMSVKTILVGYECLIVAHFKHAIFRADGEIGVGQSDAYGLFYGVITGISGLIKIGVVRTPDCDGNRILRFQCVKCFHSIFIN